MCASEAEDSSDASCDVGDVEFAPVGVSADASESGGGASAGEEVAESADA